MTHILPKTRIVATIGPASNSEPVIEQMIRAGMNVARLNFSHGEFATHQQTIKTIRAAARTKFGDEPRCGNRCQSPCALGFGLLFDRPWTMADEVYRQALGGVRRLFSGA